MENSSSILSSFCRTVQRDAIRMQKATLVVEPEQAMRDFLEAKAAGRSQKADAARIVEAIRSTSYKFCDAMRSEKIDWNAFLEEGMKEMDQDQKLVYLYSVNLMLDACNADALRQQTLNLPSDDEIKAEIDRLLEPSGEKSGAEILDGLKKKLSESDLKAFVFAEGNEELVKVLSDPEFVSADCGAVIAPIIGNAFKKSDHYSMIACACVGQIMDGKIAGVSVENMNPEILAALVAAGCEKGSILQRLAKGEIDRERAEDLLARVESALRWVLAGIFQVLVASGVLYCTYMLIDALGLIGAAAGIVHAIGIAFACFAMISSKQDAQNVSDLLVDFAKMAASVPVRAAKKAYGFASGKAAARTDSLQEA